MKYLTVLLISIFLINIEEKVEVTAVITALEGNVKIFRGKTGEVVTAQLLYGFFEGDSLKTEADGKATVFYNDGKIVTINENYNNEITAIPFDTITRQTKDIKKVSLRTRSIISSLFVFVSEDKKASYKLGVREEEDSFSVAIYTPGNTALTEGKPNILWRSYPGAQFYTVLIQMKDTAVMSVTTVDTFSSYLKTKEELTLSPGSYCLKVSALKDADVLNSAKRFFKILDPEEVDRINNAIADIKAQNSDAFTLHLLNAKVYEETGLILNAIEEYEILLKMKPNMPFIYHTLSIFYNKIGRPEIGNQYLNRYEDLTAEKQ